MAIVKAKYVRGKSRIKAHLRYITHRRGMEGERMSRPLFGRDGALSKQQIYEMIDAAKRGAVFHKFVINFHPHKEDTRKDLNLWELTRKTLEQIKTQFGEAVVPFVATIHDDHTLLRHVHGFFIVEGRLSKEEFAKIRGLWKVASAEVRPSAGALTACMRVSDTKNYCRLSRSTSANTSRGGDGEGEQSGCSRPVCTAAMGACPA